VNEPSNARLAEFVRKVAERELWPSDKHHLLVVAQRLEAREVSEEMVKAAASAICGEKSMADCPFEAVASGKCISCKAEARAALQAALKGGEP
jgi:hypothetical protein